MVATPGGTLTFLGMSAFHWDDDLLDFAPETGADAGAEHDDFEDGSLADDASMGKTVGAAGSGASSKEDSLGTLDAASGPRARKRGSRGGAASKAGSLDGGAREKRWRSGAIPPAPVFDGNIEAEPFCLRHYRRRLRRWVRITREYLPPNEQALRALEQLRGEAEIELEETDDNRYDVANGIDILLKDLETSFGERELFRQGGTIREFESISRLQGESVTAFVRRFRLLERKLTDNKVAPYPEEARVIKLLDGLKLDEKATAALLLAAGNKYKMDLVLEAVRIQYPAGMSITGLPRSRQDLRRLPRPRGGRGPLSSASSTRTSSSSRSSATRTTRNWKQWHADWDGWEDGETMAEPQVLNQGDVDIIPEEGEYDIVDENENHDEDEYYPEEQNEEVDYANGYGHEDYGEEEWPEQGVNESQALLMAAEALTVTSKKLAGLAQARGYYNPDGKGKAKGKGSGNGKGSKGKASGKGKSKGGKGKPSQKGKAKLDISNPVQQQRLKGSLCLGCGSPDHWLRDCPSFTVHNAQVTSASYAGMTLDAEGAVASWMVFCWGEKAEPQQPYELPELSSDDRFVAFPDFVQAAGDFICASDPFPRNPHVLLQYHDCCNSAYMIADTGCQRQVAGQGWHDQKMQEILPLKGSSFRIPAGFRLGEGIPSQGRYAYPAAVAGVPMTLCVLRR